MHITVAICTWNRCELLRRTLEQFARVTIPPQVDWELLVVNNNSTDSTDEVIQGFSDRLPIRRLYEPNPGKSQALNLASREATGEYILWTDDDVLVDKNWIAAYCEAFQRYPAAVFFGGPIEPLFAKTPPPWLDRAWRHIGVAYALRDFGQEPIPLDGTDVVPFGANLAIRTSEQTKYCYDVNLGPRPNSALRGEETTLVKTLVDEGYQGWWVPNARVRHYIPVERMCIRYIRRFFFGQGAYREITEPVWNGPKLFGKARWLWKYALTCEAKYLIKRLISQPEQWMPNLVEASIAWGRLRTPT